MRKIIKFFMLAMLAFSCAVLFFACGGNNGENSGGKVEIPSVFVGITFSDSTYTYDGTEKEIFVSGTLPDGVTVEYQNNGGTNAGTYNARAILSCEGYDSVTLTATLTIGKATYDMSDATWDYSESFTYDGTEKSVTVSGLPDGVTVASYNNNAKTTAGEYTASVTLSYDTTNYNAVSINSLSWTIGKATYDMSGAKWSYKLPFVFNGNERTVEVTGLPAGVTVASYQNNAKTEEGTYTASVTLSYDSVNYNAVSIADLVWRIIPDVAGIAERVVNNMLKVPDPWEFLPESFTLQNKAYGGNTEIDYTSFISVSSLPKVAIGKQMNVVYSVLTGVDDVLEYLREFYGYANLIIDLYQDYLNSDPDDYANFEKTTDKFTFKITVSDSDYFIYVSYKSVAIELSFELETQKCYGRVQITDNNVIKYEMAEDSFTVAYNALGLALTELHFERNDNIVAGYLYEYYGTESKNIKTSALIKIDNDYTSIISDKRELEDMDLSAEGNMEVYKNSTGNLVGAEVREHIKSVKYETSWFNIYDVVGINTIKVIDEVNGKNADTIYINGSENPIKTKLVGGLSTKSLSRRFDIEMKDMYVFVLNGETGKYDKVKIEIPMLFVQNDYISSFSADFYNTNKDYGAVDPTSITMASADSSYLFSKYNTLIDAYLVIKAEVSYQSIKDYIGNKNEYFA